ncbi:S-layer homology domain-containing protein [Oscillospiraceae bacterium OttesenSCG-928-G22]|nr:S-layer homology domain-containing protein [Oscillospiraceae bacterium OttesenSCG-928-G22]
MKYLPKKLLSLLLASIILLLPLSAAAADGYDDERFSDVPPNHWAAADIYALRDLGIAEGMGPGFFGLGFSVSRAEFATFLARLLGWTVENPATGSFADNQNPQNWYYRPIETAVKNGAILTDTEYFRPTDPITREEMAVMLVRAIGYGELVERIPRIGPPFNDVAQYAHYIAVAKDFGIIDGVSETEFRPKSFATREQAAAMIMRLYRRLKQPLGEITAFYAISSYSQRNLISDLSAVSFGWSRLTASASGELRILTEPDDGNDFYLPEGYAAPLDIAQRANTTANLMVYADNLQKTIDGKQVPFLEYVLSDSARRDAAVRAIVDTVGGIRTGDSAVTFDGVTIDFELLSGSANRQYFVSFLTELRALLGDRPLYVTVHPALPTGQSYYNGYDFRAISEIADRVILMAHDYNAKSLSPSEMEAGYTATPLAPLESVYYSLQALCDPQTGVSDPAKVLLQLSFDSCQWKLSDGKVLNESAYRPTYDAINRRLQSGVETMLGVSMAPYAEFTDEDGNQNVLWFENSESVLAKINLAKMFGVSGVSLWRLGTIPDYKSDTGLDVFSSILNEVR